MTATLEITEDQRLIGQGLIDYREKPIDFYVDILGVPRKHIWSGLTRVAESLAEHQLTAVPAGHSVSKTFGGGRSVIWFKECFQPSTVITTAPSDKQVKNQLWKEIHAAYAGAKVDLGGKITALQWDLKPSAEVLAGLPTDQRQQWEKNFAIGFATSPDTATEHATRMQGWHNEWLYILIDEAGGIIPQIWRTIMEGLVTNDKVKVLAIGNATDPNSEFAQACKPGSGWNVVRVSALDTPNYKERREVIPGLAGYEWVERLRKKYGTGGNNFLIRCLGKFPTFKEGTYYGFEVARARDKGQFDCFSYDPTSKVYGFWDLGDVYSVGLFVQFRNGRIRVIDSYYDNRARGLPEYAKVVDAKDFIWAKHYAGPDLTRSNKSSVQTGMATRDVAIGLGMNIEPVIPHAFNDGVEAVRSIWPLLDVNKVLCKDLIDAVGQYGKKKNDSLSTEDKPVFYNEPVKNYTRHFADALRHLAIFYRYMFEEGCMGYATDGVDEDAWQGGGGAYSQNYDPLGAVR